MSGIEWPRADNGGSGGAVEAWEGERSAGDAEDEGAGDGDGWDAGTHYHDDVNDGDEDDDVDDVDDDADDRHDID